MPALPARSHRSSHAPRPVSSQRGYDSTHRAIRILCFLRDDWRCVQCGWEPYMVTMFRDASMGVPPTQRILDELRLNYQAGARHLHADHIQTIDDRPDLRLELSNMQTLCNACHGLKTRAETAGI